MSVTLHLGDCLTILPTLEANSVDSIVTDPPYGLSKEPDIVEVLTHWLAGDDYKHTGGGFMGKSWDSFVPGPAIWKECYRVLKPGGYLLSFASTRTFDLMAIALRLAGFEQHPFLAWVFGSGFPKASNLGKMLDKMAGAEREVIQTIRKTPSAASENMNEGWTRPWAENHPKTMDITAPATPEAEQWDGWFYGKQSLKPAMEPILMFQKPAQKGLNMAQNVLTWGTGAVNVDGCRVGTNGDNYGRSAARKDGTVNKGEYFTGTVCGVHGHDIADYANPQGRWPANVILSYPEDEYDEAGNLLPNPGRDEVVGMFPETTSGSRKGPNPNATNALADAYAGGWKQTGGACEGSTGSAARFFYCAKASKRDRDEGCEGLEAREAASTSNGGKPGKVMTVGAASLNGTPKSPPPSRNFHPCVKPTSLMRYLVRLVTPPGGTVLDPFMGSGSTGKGAMLEGFNFIGVEMEAEYLEIARRRIEHARREAQAAQPLLLAAD